MRTEKYFFTFTILAALVLTFFLLKPFATYLVLAAILTYFLLPLKQRLVRHVRNEALCVAFLIVLVILLVVVPSFYLTSHLVNQVTSAYDNFKETILLQRMSSYIQLKTGREINFQPVVLKLMDNIRGFVLGAAPNFLGSLASLALGLFTMFFVMYYALLQPAGLGKKLTNIIPLDAELKQKMVEEIRAVLKGVLYGQLVTSLVHGALEGLGFFFFGIPNTVFWAVLMVILSFIPVLGTPMVWVPAAIYLWIIGHPWFGLALLAYSSVVTAVVDNVLKPKLISGKSNIHPVIVLIGVLGGLNLFGFIGLVIGPLLLAMLIRLLVFYEEVYLPKQG
jgi:predicted PurR-regulated permease PerM